MFKYSVLLALLSIAYCNAYVTDSFESNFSNKYTLWVAGATENYYEGTAITAGGYTTSNFSNFI